MRTIFLMLLFFTSVVGHAFEYHFVEAETGFLKVGLGGLYPNVVSFSGETALRFGAFGEAVRFDSLALQTMGGVTRALTDTKNYYVWIRAYNDAPIWPPGSDSMQFNFNRDDGDPYLSTYVAGPIAYRYPARVWSWTPVRTGTTWAPTALRYYADNRPESKMSPYFNLQAQAGSTIAAYIDKILVTDDPNYVPTDSVTFPGYITDKALMYDADGDQATCPNDFEDRTDSYMTETLKSSLRSFIRNNDYDEDGCISSEDAYYMTVGSVVSTDIKQDLTFVEVNSPASAATLYNSTQLTVMPVIYCGEDWKAPDDTPAIWLQKCQRGGQAVVANFIRRMNQWVRDNVKIDTRKKVITNIPKKWGIFLQDMHNGPVTLGTPPNTVTQNMDVYYEIGNIPSTILGHFVAPAPGPASGDRSSTINPTGPTARNLVVYFKVVKWHYVADNDEHNNPDDPRDFTLRHAYFT